MTIKQEKTQRGFRIDRFTDANGVECSLQISSAMDDEALVWLGCQDIGLKKFVPYEGWSDVELEQNAPYGITHLANTRMHLTQSQVAALLPALMHFVETGSLPSNETEPATDEDEITALRKELAEARAALESADARISLLVEDFKTTDRVTKVYAIRATFVALSDIRSALRPPSKAKGEKK